MNIPVKNNDLNLKWPEEAIREEKEWIATRRSMVKESGETVEGPLSGLSLSGGGVRAAFIARGFLDGLLKNSELRHFDYMSSVSGGGYAASMLIARGENTKNSPAFDRNQFPLRSPDRNIGFYIAALLFDFLINFVPVFFYFTLFFLIPILGDSQIVPLAFPFSLTLLSIFLIASTPIFRRFQGKEKFETLLKSSLGMSWILSIGLAVNYFGMWWPLIISLAVLMGTDWYVKIVSHRYVTVINSAFMWLFFAVWASMACGLVMFVSELGISSPRFSLFILAIVFIGLSQSAILNIRFQNRLNFTYQKYKENLRKIFLPANSKQHNIKLHEVENKYTPYPIFNAALNLGAGLCLFELAPLYSGADAFGYEKTQSWLPDVHLADAMAISASAADLLAGGIRTLSILGAMLSGLGYWIPTSLDEKEERRLLAFDRIGVLIGLRPALAMRLSDGGFVDNLGVLVLMKRRVKTIVCLDCSEDPKYEFEDLRKLCVSARVKGLGKIFIENIESASQEYKFRQNKSSILFGRIEYPEFEENREAFGIYVHIKANATNFDIKDLYKDFPHFSTFDQELIGHEIELLVSLGNVLAEEYLALKSQKQLVS